MPRPVLYFILSIQLIVLAACTTNVYRAPVVDIGQTVEPSGRTTVVLTNGPRHRVNRGETLYAIAWMHDIYYQDLARVNNIPPPYVIYPGQELSLEVSNIPAQAQTPTVASTPSRNPPRTSPQTSPQTSAPPPVVSTNNQGNAQSRAAGVNNALLRWTWPANGSVIAGFSSAENANKGLNIAGLVGDPIYAAEAGEVVYAGNALLRYGELIIIKHNDQFLSAYAHNDSLNVSEGEMVTRGQRIASLGSTGIDREMLHFEIRLAGQPVDPAQYLPPR